MIMENMHERIARRDIKQERAEAIKVRSHPTRRNITHSNEVTRQCVILQQTVH